MNYNKFLDRGFLQTILKLKSKYSKDLYEMLSEYKSVNIPFMLLNRMPLLRLQP